MSITTEVQKSSADSIVDLYVLDTTPIGGTDIYRFTPGSNKGRNTFFDGHLYSPIDIEATGFRWDGKGPFGKPKIQVANMGGIVSAMLIAYGDVVGARFYRIRTFAQFLDTGDNPDPLATFPIEIYTVDQLVSRNKIFVEWQLSSPMDQLATKLPKRQCIRDTCTHTYRIWDSDTESFDYSNASCPYTGSAVFNEKGQVASFPKNDSCGRGLEDCRLRFGDNPLPTRAFPGITKGRG